MTSLQDSLRACLASHTDAELEEALMRWMQEQLRYYLRLQREAIHGEWNRKDIPAGMREVRTNLWT